MRPNTKLRFSITELGENDGAYIIVSSKGSVADTAYTARKNKMAAAIADTPSAANLYLDYYDRQRVASWVNSHPGLIPWVKNRVGTAFIGWRPYEDWSSSPSPITDLYIIDNSVRLVGPQSQDRGGHTIADGIKRVREVLNKPGGVVRLVGLSGVGKTRFVQALFEETIGEDPLSLHLAVYTDIAEQPDPLPLELCVRLQNLRQRCILIIDNCGVALHQKLAARFQNEETRLSLITIEYDIDVDEPEGTDVFRLEPSSSDVIEKILRRKHPNLSNPEIRTIASFSEGNSRVALALATTAVRGESLANLKDKDLFARLFRQRKEDNPALLQTAKACSLVHSFDGETQDGDNAEVPILAALAGQSIKEFCANVAELARRQLIQTRTKWRAFLPHALAHRLAKEALEEISIDEICEHLINRAPQRLIVSFSRRLGCLHDSPDARKIGKAWIEEGRWLSNIESLDNFHVIVFDNVAPVNPDASLDCIERAITSLQDLQSEKTELRRRLSRILRSFAYEPRLFDRSIQAIAGLISREEKSNNLGDASNLFVSLFRIYLSGTLAPAEQRADALRRFAISETAVERTLSINGLMAMLQCSGFSSAYGFEFGARKRDYGLSPEKREDVTHWFKTALELCRDMERLPAHRQKVRTLFAQGFGELAQIDFIVDELVALADTFSADGGWPEGWAGVQKAIRAHRKNKGQKSDPKLISLAARLKPTSLYDKIVSYVLPETSTALDLAEIDYADEKKFAKANADVEATCTSIGKALACDFGALGAHLPILLTSRSNRCWTVGVAIGLHATEPKAAWDLVLSQYLSLDVDKQEILLYSFVRGLSIRNSEVLEIILNEVVQNEALHPLFVRIQAVAGISDQGYARLVEVTKIKSIPTDSFSHLAHQNSPERITGAQIYRLVQHICERENGDAVCLYILYYRMAFFTSDDKTISDDDRDAGRYLLNVITFDGERESDGHRLAKLAKICLTPTDETIIRGLCVRLLASLCDYRISTRGNGELIGVLAANAPRTVLDVLVADNSSIFETRRNIFYSFRENNPCPLDQIGDDTLFRWANEDPAVRFLALAECIRVWKKCDGTNVEGDDAEGAIRWTARATRLMNEAPDPVSVAQCLYKRFRPSGWSGSLADIMESRLVLLKQLIADQNETIAKWAYDAAVSFSQEIAEARRWDAKHRRESDERFDW